MLSLSFDNAVLNSLWPVLAIILRYVPMLLHCPLHELIFRGEHFRECINKNFIFYEREWVYVFPILDIWALTVAATPIELFIKLIRMPHTLLRNPVVSYIFRPPFTIYYFLKWAKHNLWVDNLLQIGSLMTRIVTTPYCFWVIYFYYFFNVDFLKGSNWPDIRDTNRVRFW